jgi:hypothetical protein
MHDPARIVAMWHSWLILMVPEKPVAGEFSNCVI